MALRYKCLWEMSTDEALYRFFCSVTSNPVGECLLVVATENIY